MSKKQHEVKQFLEKSKDILKTVPELSDYDDFLNVIKRENIRQIKDQLAVDLQPVLTLLSRVDSQQTQIIRLLESKLDLDKYEKEIMDLLKKKLEKE